MAKRQTTRWLVMQWALAWVSGQGVSFLPNAHTSADSSGRWCPRVTNRLVSCLQPQWAWSPSGRRIYQQKKRVFRLKKEVQWTCCPGFQGDKCQQECFNCTLLHDVLSRLKATEDFIDSFQYKDAAVRQAVPLDLSKCKCPRGPKGETGPPGPRGHPGLPGRVPASGQIRGKAGEGQIGPVRPQGPKGDTGERRLPGPHRKRGPRRKPSKAEERREKDQEKRIAGLESRVQELEGELAELRALLNASVTVTEQWDVLQERVVLLEEIFLRLSDNAGGKSPPTNATQKEVGDAAAVERHLRQAEDPDIAPLSAREFRASQTLTSGHVTHRGDVKCACSEERVKGPPPPPPIPAEVLQAMFPGQNISLELLTRRGFCRRIRAELKELFRKNFDFLGERAQPPSADDAPSEALLPNDSPQRPEQSPKTKASKMAPSTPASHTSPSSSSPSTRKVKVIDLMKNWRPLGDARTTRPGSQGEREEERDAKEREVIRQFSVEFTQTGTGLASRSEPWTMGTAGVFVCLTRLVTSWVSSRVTCL